MGFVLYILYNVVSPLVFLFVSLISFLSSRHSFSDNINALKERLSPSANGLPQKAIWLHGASIGEIKALTEVVLKIRELKPEVHFIITASTISGKIEALKLTPYARVIPADFYPLIRKFIKNIKPAALFIAETEIWPNLLILASRECPVKIINARISDRTFSSYLKIRPLIRYSLKNLSAICSQSKDDAQKYSFFYPVEKIKIHGNIKYDSLKKDEKLVNIANEKLKKFISKDRPVIIFGSTHQKEEEIISQTLEILKKENLNVFAIIFPRHINRATATYEIFSKKLKTGLLSRKEYFNLEVLIVDETGFLSGAYCLADICFVGGTLDETGGHNLLEPSVYARPVLFGTNFANVREAAKKLLENRGGFTVKDAYDLAARIKILLKDEKLLKASGENSLRTLDSLKGASARIILEMIN